MKYLLILLLLLTITSLAKAEEIEYSKDWANWEYEIKGEKYCLIRTKDAIRLFKDVEKIKILLNDLLKTPAYKNVVFDGDSGSIRLDDTGICGGMLTLWVKSGDTTQIEFSVMNKLHKFAVKNLTDEGELK